MGKILKDNIVVELKIKSMAFWDIKNHICTFPVGIKLHLIVIDLIPNKNELIEKKPVKQQWKSFTLVHRLFCEFTFISKDNFQTNNILMLYITTY